MLGADRLFKLADTGTQKLYRRVLLGEDQPRFGQIVLELFELDLFAAAQITGRGVEPPRSLIHLLKAQALLAQIGDLAVKLQLPVLQAGLLAAQIILVLRQSIGIFAFEFQNTRRLDVQLGAKPRHFLLEEFLRLAGAVRAKLRILLQDQGQIFIENRRRLLRLRGLEAHRHQGGFVAPRRAFDLGARAHPVNDLVGVHAFLIIKHIQTLGDIEHIVTGQKPRFEQLQLLFGRKLHRAFGQIARDLRAFHHQPRLADIGGGQGHRRRDCKARDQPRNDQGQRQAPDNDRKIVVYRGHQLSSFTSRTAPKKTPSSSTLLIVASFTTGLSALHA